MILLLAAILSVANGQSIRNDIESHPNWPLLSDFQEECGENTVDRIIGGVNASLGQYPWLARLGYSYDLDPEEETLDMYECGGAIINKRYILTAAHCGPDQVKFKLLQVRLGEFYTETDPDCDSGVCAPPVQDINVEKVTCNKDYSPNTFHNDICLVRLKKDIQFNNFVQPICLPIYDSFLKENFENEVMEVAGWGIYDLDIGTPNTILQTVKVPITNQELCKKKYKNKATIIDTQFCAGGVVGRDSCSGDSGGPIMKPFAIDAPPKYFVLGVVSFGPTRCGETDSPGVYTKVAVFMKWILDNIKP